MDRLYLSRKKGGRGLKSIEDVVQEEKCYLFRYLLRSKESLLTAVFNSGLIETSETKCEFVKRKQSERWTSYSQKALHGNFVRSRDKNVDELASSYWLTKGELTFETEGLIMAAQDQALSTRALQQVYSGSGDTRRLCNNQHETVEHLISGCSRLAGTSHKVMIMLLDTFTGVYVASTALIVIIISGNIVLLVS